MHHTDPTAIPSPTPPPSTGDQPMIGYAQPGTSEPAGRLEPYNRVAETVGMVPSLRWKDNVVQAVIVLIGTLIGAIVGYWFLAALTPGPALLLGALAGLILSTLLSGLFLMLLRLRRG